MKILKHFEHGPNYVTLTKYGNDYTVSLYLNNRASEGINIAPDRTFESTSLDACIEMYTKTCKAIQTNSPICVEDFSGHIEPGHFFTQYWADYDPLTHILSFGGDWNFMPDLFVSVKPTALDCKMLVEYYQMGV